MLKIAGIYKKIRKLMQREGNAIKLEGQSSLGPVIGLLEGVQGYLGILFFAKSDAMRKLITCKLINSLKSHNESQ